MSTWTPGGLTPPSYRWVCGMVALLMKYPGIYIDDR